MVVDQGRRGGQRQRRLRHVVARIGLDQLGEFGAFFRCGARADQHAVAARFIRRLDHQFVEIGQHVFLLVLVHAQVAGHVRDDRVLIQVVLDHLGDEGIHHLVVRHAGAGRIGDADIAGAPGPHQAFDAEGGVFPEGFRVEEVVIDAAIDHIDPAQTGDGLHVDAVVLLHHQVAAFDQERTHFLRQVAVLEIGRVEDARRQHHHDRARAHAR